MWTRQLGWGGVEGAGMVRKLAYVTKDSDLDHAAVCEMAQNGPRRYRVIIIGP